MRFGLAVSFLYHSQCAFFFDTDYDTVCTKEEQLLSPGLHSVLLPCLKDSTIVKSANLSAGHENMGIVEELGEGVTLLKKGDRVVMPFNVADGRCRNCEEGRTAFCTGVNPGFAGGAYGKTSNLIYNYVELTRPRVRRNGSLPRR